jgi:hypothetical protein
MRNRIQDLQRRLNRAAPKIRRPRREFSCPIISETVIIGLRRTVGFGQSRGTTNGFFVQCNQVDCQYAESNTPPCPLHVGLFEHELEARGFKRSDNDQDELKTGA